MVGQGGIRLPDRANGRPSILKGGRRAKRDAFDPPLVRGPRAAVAGQPLAVAEGGSNKTVSPS